MEPEVESREKSKVDPQLGPKKKEFMEKGKTGPEVNITRFPKTSSFSLKLQYCQLILNFISERGNIRFLVIF